jgi:hypothetical protein
MIRRERIGKMDATTIQVIAALRCSDTRSISEARDEFAQSHARLCVVAESSRHKLPYSNWPTTAGGEDGNLDLHI